MTEATPGRFIEDRIPLEGIEETFAELVELYGGEVTASRDREREFTLPLLRGQASGGAVECTISWADDTVTITCDRLKRAQFQHRLVPGTCALERRPGLAPPAREFGNNTPPARESALIKG